MGLANDHGFLNYGTIPKAYRGRIFRSTPPSRLNKAGLKCPYVRPSTKCFFDFDEIWYVGRGQRLMHDGMQYDPNQGQGQLRSRALESRKFNHFQRLSPPPFTMWAGK